MTLEEALKYLEAGKSGVIFNLEAIQLGIEALKDLKAFRIKYPHTPLLPGETEK